MSRECGTQGKGKGNLWPATTLLFPWFLLQWYLQQVHNIVVELSAFQRTVLWLFPDVTNRTFRNRTQSNFNRSIDLDWVRQSNIIELTQTFCQSNTIERSKMEHFNQTASNS